MRNKYNVTIKSIITKLSAISWGNKWLKQYKNPPKEKQIWGEKERERERERVLTFFAINNLEGIGERGENEVKRNL